jgi:S1-C subfamily serine protease
MKTTKFPFARFTITCILAATLAGGSVAAQDKDRGGEPVPREGLRSQREENRARADAELRIEDVKAADLGLWFSRQTRDGLVIVEAAPTGAIAQFGFREGDRIVSVNGLPVRAESDFLQSLLAKEVLYRRVPVVLLRDDRRQIVYIRPDALVAELETVSVDPLQRLGIELDDRYATRIVVWRVASRSPAWYAGIRSGDVITTFDGQRVFDAGEFVGLVDRAEPILMEMQVARGQQTKDLVVDLSIDAHLRPQRTLAVRPLNMERTYNDIRSVDPSSDRRLRPRPDVRPGMLVPGGEVGRDRGPISPAGAAMGTPTAPPTPGFSR